MRGIDFGGKSKAKTVHPNRAGPWNMRAEMYGRLREFIIEGGAIPDDDDLATDFSGPKIIYRANNDWLLMSKSEMKSKGIRSSDLTDACALTFASNEWFDSWSKPKKEKGFNQGGPQLKKIASPGIGDNDGFYELSGTNTGWMA